MKQNYETDKTRDRFSGRFIYNIQHNYVPLVPFSDFPEVRSGIHRSQYPAHGLAEFKNRTQSEFSNHPVFGSVVKHVAKSENETASWSVMGSWLKTGTLKRKIDDKWQPQSRDWWSTTKENKTSFSRKWLDEFSWLVLGSKGAIICSKRRDTSCPSHSNKTRANAFANCDRISACG